jgi:hypothetical protein
MNALRNNVQFKAAAPNAGIALGYRSERRRPGSREQNR